MTREPETARNKPTIPRDHIRRIVSFLQKGPTIIQQANGVRVDSVVQYREKPGR